MKRIRFLLSIILISTYLSTPNVSGESTFEKFKSFINQHKSRAVRILSLPNKKTATGVVVLLKRENNQKSILITNKHVVEGAKYLQISLQICKDYKAIDTMMLDVNLYSANDSALFNIHDEELDIVSIEFDISKAASGKRGELTALVEGSFVDLSEIEVGEEVVFSGFPLGITVNNIEPILRFGMISGIDTVKNLIFLDAQSFGGSSGSPVFLKPPGLKESRIFVGLIASYIPYQKQLINIETGKIEMLQYENSGIAIVMPSWEIRKLLDKY